MYETIRNRYNSCKSKVNQFKFESKVEFCLQLCVKSKIAEDMANEPLSEEWEWLKDHRAVMFISGFFVGFLTYRILQSRHLDWFDNLDQTLAKRGLWEKP